MTNLGIEAKLRSAIQKETPDILEQVLSAHENKEGVLIMTEMNSLQKRPSRKWIRWAVAAAAAILLFVGGGIGFNYVYGVESLVSIDVNPGVEMKLSRSERVVDITALNTEAEVILDGMELKGTHLNVAVNALIGSMVKYGYINEIRNSVLISVESPNQNREEKLQNEIATSINGALQQNALSAAVLKQPAEETDVVKQMVQTYGISFGKASLIQRILDSDPTQTPEQLAQLNINDLSLLAIAKEPSATNLIAYGEVSDGAYIGRGNAEKIALDKAGEGQIMALSFDYENGRTVYEGEIFGVNKKYEFDIDAVTGEIVQWEEEIFSILPDETAGYIGEEKAKQLVLEKASGGNFVEFKLDIDDGKIHYEGKLVKGDVKYEFEISAIDGRILEWEEERHNNMSTDRTGGYIDEEKAKQLVLKKVPGGNFVEFKLDIDDSVAIYEGELVKDRTQYEFEIDAVSGQFLKWEID